MGVTHLIYSNLVRNSTCYNVAYSKWNRNGMENSDTFVQFQLTREHLKSWHVNKTQGQNALEVSDLKEKTTSIQVLCFFCLSLIMAHAKSGKIYAQFYGSYMNNWNKTRYHCFYRRGISFPKELPRSNFKKWWPSPRGWLTSISIRPKQYSVSEVIFWYSIAIFSYMFTTGNCLVFPTISKSSFKKQLKLVQLIVVRYSFVRTSTSKHCSRQIFEDPFKMMLFANRLQNKIYLVSFNS